MTTSHVPAIQAAVDQMGSQKALALALGVTAVTVNQWLRVGVARARPVSPKQCVRIEQLTAGRVSRRDLRPDDWGELWPELAEKPGAPAAVVGVTGAAHA